MKGAVFALLCALALVSAELNENGCPINPYIDVLIPHPNCNKFYQCLQGDLYERKCASTLVFNIETQQCDWPEDVDCENRTPVVPVSSEEAEKSGESDNSNGNDDPSLAPEICAAEDSDGILVAHEQCNKFYQCHNSVPVVFGCAPLNLVFNPSTEACDWPENVDCGHRTPGGDGDNGNGDGDNNGDGGVGDSNGENGNGEDNNSGDNSSENGNDSENGGGNDDPSLAPEICAAEDSNGILFAHEQCNKFYICNNGVPVERNCAPVDLVFNPTTGACDWPKNVDCGNRIPGGEGDSGNGDGDNNGDGGNGDGGDGDGNGDNGNGEDNNSGGNSSEDSNDSGNGGDNDDPSLAPEICAAEDSNGILVAHEQCNKFYICNNGVPVERNCAPVDLVFNPSTGACDWPKNVDCGNRIPGGEGDSGNGDGDNNGDGGVGDGNGDNGNGEDSNSGDNSSEDGNNSGNGGGNDDPSLAPEICAAKDSNGILVAHEQCNKFYICSNGVPVERNCAPVNLVFNPTTGACDWPENVDCGNRTPGGDGDNGNGDADSGNGSNSEENNSSDGDNGNVEEDNGNNVGGGNGNPGEAQEICAAESSDGVLVAHENCNQFYKCSEGKPVALVCPSTLLFNPKNNECDWPENVNCNGRNPDSGNGDSGNGDNGNGDEGNGDSDNGNGNGGNEGGDNGNNVGGGNANPSEAPEICATEGSDGVLVAHENCNQFYKCSKGKPVAYVCPPTLLFNPNYDVCDWPENVNCDGRDQDSGNGDNDNGGNGNGDEGKGDSENGNGDGGNGGGDNGNNIGGGNANPSEAPEICAAKGSGGVLVAHENCNQFYKCSEGKPVAYVCPPTLLFNPNNDQCDWPANVNCDGRNSDTGNGDNDNGGNGNGDEGKGDGDNGNGDGGNGGGDNGNNIGGGNVNPREAAEICAAEGSDGALVAHENCNKFYKCSEGKPMAYVCPPPLMFNPNYDVCDWSENVNCDGRDQDSGNGDSGNGDEGNGDGDSGNGDGDNESNLGGGNSNPSEAPEICAAKGSDGVLVAHENCNQFYKCSEGEAVVIDCPPPLLFNPNYDVCDWPENVNCDGRDQDSGNGDSGNGDEGNGDGDSGNGDGDNESNLGGGNSNPSEAPEICAATDSDGVLVAHENCNQFYKCSEGEPVVLDCPLNLLFNPTADVCDWPENVDCGTRYRFISFNKHLGRFLQQMRTQYM